MAVAILDACLIFAATGRICRFDFAYMVSHVRKNTSNKCIGLHMGVTILDACFIFAATGRICRFDFAYMDFYVRKLACLVVSWAILGATCGHPEST